MREPFSGAGRSRTPSARATVHHYGLWQSRTGLREQWTRLGSAAVYPHVPKQNHFRAKNLLAVPSSRAALQKAVSAGFDQDAC